MVKLLQLSAEGFWLTKESRPSRELKNTTSPMLTNYITPITKLSENRNRILGFYIGGNCEYILKILNLTLCSLLKLINKWGSNDSKYINLSKYVGGSINKL